MKFLNLYNQFSECSRLKCFFLQRSALGLCYGNCPVFSRKSHLPSYKSIYMFMNHIFMIMIMIDKLSAMIQYALRSSFSKIKYSI